MVVVVHRPEGGADAALEGNQAIRTVLHLDDPLVGAVGHGAVDGVNVIPAKPAHQVQGVDGLVDNRPASLLVPCPLPVTLRIVGVVPVPGHVALGRQYLPQTPRIQALPNQLRARIVPILENHPQATLVFLRRLHHLLGLLHGDRHGLLRQDVAAQLHRLDGHRGMEVMGKTNVHHVQLRLLDHLHVVRVAHHRGSLAVPRKQLRHGLGTGGNQIADGTQIHIGLGFGRHAMKTGNATTANDANTQLLHE